MFIKDFLTPEFSVIDFWYRFEWQNRGSGHIHGFLWFKNAPNLSYVSENLSENSIIIEYFDRLVRTINPNMGESLNAQEHPYARVIPTDANLDADDDGYENLINWVMRHSRSGNYYLRLHKTTKQMTCRFKYPFDVIPQSKIVEDPPNSKIFHFISKRNDPLVCSHNRKELQVWRANIDWYPVLSVHAVVNYIGKYAAKSEPVSKMFIDTFRSIVENVHKPCKTSTSAIKKILLKTVSERDISAQEVRHLLMSYPLVRSFRTIVQLTASEKSMLSTVIRRRNTTADEDMVESDPNFNMRCMDRPPEHENLSLFDMAKNFRFYNKDWHKLRTEAVVRIIPDLKSNIPPFSENWEFFCEQQVLLHHHYRNLNEAKGNFDTWSDRYIDLGLIQPQSLPDAVEDDFEINNDVNDIEENQQEEWMMAAAMGPLFVLEEEVEIGLRDFDTSYNWNESLQRYPNIETERNFIHNNLRSVLDSTNDRINGSILVPLERLSENQRTAHDMIYKSIIAGKSIRMIICGGAGTGKSTLINAIVHTIVTHFGNSKAVRIMAPTGVAAFNIGGSTIHHELSISAERKSSYKEISREQCRRMQDDFEHTNLIIIDEYSMLGRTMIANIDLRCRDIFSVNDIFGGVSIVLVGDMRQLPPVCDSPLYMKGGNLMQQRGELAYMSFNKCLRLSYIFRQAGDDQAPFREALERLSRSASIIDDWKLFKTRDWLTLSENVKENFRNALYLFPTRMTASEHNKNHLIQLGKPIARILSLNNCETASTASADDAKGLEKCIYLSVGARVMLRSNLSVQNGLVNGAVGIVVDIVYSRSTSSPIDLPLAMMVNFDKYHGIEFRHETNIIPITPQIVNWKTSSSTTCTRTQLTLGLCWAITIHKSQGLTFDQTIIDIGDKESLGLTFVALSKTKKLKDLAFNPMFTFERLAHIGKSKGLLSRLMEEERLDAMSFR